MFSSVRRRLHLTPSAVIASLALVFAMSGGAYAASRYVITSTKQISPKVLKSLTGKAGAKGAAGAGGAVGAQGAQGPAGASGKDGAAGPQGPAGPQGAAGLAGKNGKPGLPGETGFTETLPSGSTETGAWVVGGQYDEVALSFSIPLKAGLSSEGCGFVVAGHVKETCHVHYINSTGKEVILNFEGEYVEVASTQCSGSADAPTAAAGNLCVYEGHTHNLKTGASEISNPSGSSEPDGGAAAAGAGVKFLQVLEVPGEENPTFNASGTWAVTAG